MTDIPQLRADLVAAGVRRRTRARARTALVTAVSAVVAVAALTRIDAPREEEAPAPATSDSRRLTDAYAVFRRPARRADRFPAGRVPGPRNASPAEVVRTRFVGRVEDRRYFLVETSQGHLCLLIADGGGGCGEIARHLDGKAPIGTHSDEQGPADLVFAFPDGVRDVAATTIAGEVIDLPVVRNAVATRVRSRVSRLTWAAPDGTPQAIEFGMAPVVEPRDHFSALAGVDEHTVAEEGDVRAILTNRDGRLCLRVQAAAEGLEGCRDKPADIRRAAVVILATNGRRVLAAAFPDGTRDVRLRLVDGRSRRVAVRRNAVLVADARDVVAIRYRNPADRIVIDRLPASARSAVLNAEVRR